ncbi:DUF6087 family protein [Kitasatospora sp. NPDC096077]|uniref:DUF6087 family protein n=1 Tax=Kitasatospora sp. NPDC096077 TaxID=3155544 RepID=UPI0033303EC7
MDEDEPLELWAECRSAFQRPAGELRAVHLDEIDRPAHVNPAAPRLIERWDGVQWVPETIATDFAAAQRLVHGIRGDGSF